MSRTAQLAFLVWLAAAGAWASAAERADVDQVTREQAALERLQMEQGKSHEFSPALAAFRQTAELVSYSSGDYKLPGYLYRPMGEGPFPAVIWNHGSEKNPRAQPELAQFYTARGFVFFAPIRHGHGRAPGPYVVDLQKELRSQEQDPDVVQKKIVGLHELYNLDVVAAVEWLRTQPFVDGQRLIMSGVSYGGIQTVLSAEKGLGIRGFVPFAPAAMSFANRALRERLIVAARNAKAPMFLLQAENDYSTGPAKLLEPILKQNGQPSHARVYPPFGGTNQEGHGAFACRSLGITIWGNDVLEFVDVILKEPPAAKP
jgi:carboxymethylenebutenolidase